MFFCFIWYNYITTYGPKIIKFNFVLNIAYMELLKPFTSLDVILCKGLTPYAVQRNSNFSLNQKNTDKTLQKCYISYFEVL
jgi:hypothetical protein